MRIISQYRIAHALWSAIGIILSSPSVCLSVCLWRCAFNASWVDDTSYSKCLNKGIGSVPVGTRFYNLQPTAPTLYPQTPMQLLNHRCWCHLANKLKPYIRKHAQQLSRLEQFIIMTTALPVYMYISSVIVFGALIGYRWWKSSTSLIVLLLRYRRNDHTYTKYKRKFSQFNHKLCKQTSLPSNSFASCHFVLNMTP